MAEQGQAVIVLAAEDRTGPAFQSARRNMAALQATTRMTARDQAQLAFQLNDLFVQIASGGNPLLAVIQQGSQLSGTFGGVGGAFKAVLSTLTPLRLALGGVAGLLGGVGVAAFKGASDVRALNDALDLTGNFAGQTRGQFEALTRDLASTSTLTQTATREIAQALAGTGQIGPELFGAATEAAARFADATGKTADEVAKEFAGMSGDVSKFAADYNRSLNFLTGAQYAQIKALQDSGREIEAQAIVYDALNQRLRQLEGNLGPFDSLLNRGAKLWDEWWNAAKGALDGDTVDEQLAKVQTRLEQLNSATPFKNGSLSDAIGSIFGGESFRQEKVSEAEGQRSDLLRRQFREQENAFAESDRAQTNKAGIEAQRQLDSILERAKGAKNLTEALEENQRAFAKAAASGRVYTDAEQKVINDATRKRFTERPRRGRVNREPDQIRRAELDQQLKAIQAGLEEEQSAVRFNNEFLRGQYQDGEISLREFYTRQRAEIDRGVAAKVEALENERAAVEASLSQTRDPSERVRLETRRADIGSEIDRTREDASRAQILANQDEAKSYRDLEESVRSFQAQLAAASGQEFTAETSQIETTIQRAQTLATQSGGSITQDQIQTLREQLTIRAQINESQRTFSLLSSQASNAEERLVITARANGEGLIETEEEIRAVRQQALDQLGTLIEQTKAYAASSKDPSVLQYLDDLQTRYAQLQEVVDPRKLRFDAAADNIGSAIADGLERAVVEGGKLSDILKGIERDIVSIITREAITRPLAEGIGNIVKGTGSVSDLGSIFGIGGKREMASSAAPVAGALAGGSQILGGLFGVTESAAPLTEAVNGQAEAFANLTASTTAEAVASEGASAALGGLPGAIQTVTNVLSSFGGDIISSISGLFGGGSGGGSSFVDFFASFFHEGGVVGEAKDMRKVSFDGAPRYHTGGIAGLKPDEVPSVLLKGEEVLTQDDPRHRDNLSTKVFERLQSMKEGASLSTLEGFDTSSIATEKLIERISSDRESDEEKWSEVTRYHTGGIAGLAPDEVPAVLKKGEEVLTQADPRHRDNGGGRGDVISVNVQAQPGMSRATALQQGRDIADGFALARRRNG